MWEQVEIGDIIFLKALCFRKKERNLEIYHTPVPGRFLAERPYFLENEVANGKMLLYVFHLSLHVEQPPVD